MVTKQHQLEWLAEHFTVWPGFGQIVIKMSSCTVGEVNKGLGIAHHITRQEWQQERDKMQKQAAQPAQSAQPASDNSWYERGELPPVGCECVWADESGVDGPSGSVYPDIGDVVSICAHKQTPGGDVIAIFTWEPGDNSLHVAVSRMPSDFRPLRTEREKAIDEMASTPRPCGFAIWDICEQLYDAGYRKVKP